MNAIHFTKRGGEIVGGIDRVASALRGRVCSLRNGDYDVVVRRHERRRSLNQNRLMWLWFACIEAETGTPAQDVHDYYCAKFLTRRVFVGNVEREAVGGTSGLTERVFSAFLESVQADAATEFGIALPSPDDEAWEFFENEYKDRI